MSIKSPEIRLIFLSAAIYNISAFKKFTGEFQIRLPKNREKCAPKARLCKNGT